MCHGYSAISAVQCIAATVAAAINCRESRFQLRLGGVGFALLIIEQWRSVWSLIHDRTRPQKSGWSWANKTKELLWQLAPHSLLFLPTSGLVLLNAKLSGKRSIKEGEKEAKEEGAKNEGLTTLHLTKYEAIQCFTHIGTKGATNPDG